MPLQLLTPPKRTDTAKTAGLATSVLRSIQEIDPKEWEGVFGPEPENYYFFKTIEETLGREYRFYYIKLSEADETLGIAPCFAMDYPLSTTAKGPLKKVALALEKMLPRLLKWRILICGSLTGKGRLGFKRLSARQATGLLAAQLYLAPGFERDRGLALFQRDDRRALPHRFPSMTADHPLENRQNATVA